MFLLFHDLPCLERKPRVISGTSHLSPSLEGRCQPLLPCMQYVLLTNSNEDCFILKDNKLINIFMESDHAINAYYRYTCTIYINLLNVFNLKQFAYLSLGTRWHQSFKRANCQQQGRNNQHTGSRVSLGQNRGGASGMAAIM